MSEVPEDRCGYSTPDSDLPRGSGGLCCWLSTWDNENRCIWHAENTEKGNELLKACSERPKYLYGAVFREVDADGIDLSNCKLMQADFSEGSFVRANFSESDITFGDFSEANLHRANFSDARFLTTNFSKANLQAANLQNSYSGYADFSGANIWLADFSDSILSKCDFSSSIIDDVDFSHCELSQSDFSHAFIQGTDMSNADVSDSDLSGCELQNSDLLKTNFRKSTFREADLKKANITEADLQEVDCTKSNLQLVKLTDANLSESDLAESDLTNACLENATLPEANLKKTELVNADFTDANTRGATFDKSNLEDATFVRTELRDASLRDTKLYQTLFADTRINSNTDFGEKSAYEDPDTDLGENYDDTSQWEAAAWVYRRLQNLHEENAMSVKARDYHIAKEEAHREEYRENGECFQWGIYTLNRYLTKHGESLKHVVGWAIVIIALCGFLYPFTGGLVTANGTEQVTAPSDLSLGLFARSFYYSMVTFTTLGYGNPAGTGAKLLVGLESLAGTLLIALFVFVLGRRVAR